MWLLHAPRWVGLSLCRHLRRCTPKHTQMLIQQSLGEGCGVIFSTIPKAESLPKKAWRRGQRERLLLSFWSHSTSYTRTPSARVQKTSKTRSQHLEYR